MDEVVPRFDLGLLGADHPPEVLDVGPPPGDRRSRRRRRGMLAAVALVVAAVWGVPAWRDAPEARWLASVWATRQAYDDARDAALTPVLTRAAQGDEGAVAAAVAAVDREEATALSRLADRARDRLLLSGPARRARGPVVKALRAQAADLRAAAGDAPRTAASTASFPAAVDASAPAVSHANDVVRQLARRRRVTVPPVSVRRLTAADRFMATLRPLVDVPTGLRLVVAAAGEPDAHLLDLDSGASQNLPPLPAGYDFVVAAGHAVSTNGGGSMVVVPLTPGRSGWWNINSDVAAVTDEGLWLVEPGNAVHLVGMDGRSRSGPHPVPAGQRPVSLYPPPAQLLLTGDGGSVSRWDPRHGAPQQLAAGCTTVLAASADAVALSPCGDRRHVLVRNLVTGVTERHVLPGHLEATAAMLSTSGGVVEVHGAAPAVQDGDAICWSTPTVEVLSCGGTYDGTTATSWSSDHRWLLVAQRTVLDTQLLLLDTRTGRFHRVRLHSAAPLSAVIVP